MFLLIAMISITSLVGCTSDYNKESKVNGNANKKVSGEKRVKLHISAASLTDAINELKEIYEENYPKITLQPSYASSGDLQSQIQESTPSDVFISTAQKQMDTLEEKNLLKDGTSETLLINKVVLITPKDIDLNIKTVEDLKDDKIKQIAIGDPAHVPIGQYTEEMFQSLDLWNDLENKFRLATSVRTVLDWVETGEVDAGLVYMTDAMTSDSVKIITEVPKDSHKEVSYPIAMIKDSENKKEVQDFIDFMYTDGAKKVLEDHGFTIK